MTGETRPLYAVLGVGTDASPETVKKAYRRLALQHHPDRQIDVPDTEEAFARIAFAYEVLGHAQRRKRYDLTGEVPQSDSALGRKAAETFLAEYVKSAPKASSTVTQRDMSLHSLQNYEVLEVDGRDVPAYMRGIVMQGLSYLVAVVAGMEDKEVVLLRHFVMDQMYALLAYTPPLDEGAFASRGYIITYYDHPLQAGILPSWSDQNDAMERKAGVTDDASRLRMIKPEIIEQRRLVALEWHGEAPAAAVAEPPAKPASIPGSGASEERLRLGLRALLQVHGELGSRTVHELRRELESVLELPWHALDEVGATRLVSLMCEEEEDEEGQQQAEAAPPGAAGRGGGASDGADAGGSAKDQRVRVGPDGRLGTVLVHDPGDPDMTYKVRFDDGAPDNWFKGSDVVLA